MNTEEMKANPGGNLFLVVVLTTLAGLFYFLAPPGLASNEEGVHYIQMKHFAARGSFEITSPAQSIGFEPADVTGMRGLLEARDGRLYATPPPFFPWVASLFFPVFGERTVDFAPILFVCLSALVLGLNLDRVMQRDFLYWLLLAAFLLGSPVLMQGFQFSGMALSLLLIVSALWLLVGHYGEHPSRARLFFALVLVGASATIRPECLFIAFSYFLCTAIVQFTQKRLGDLWTVFASGVFCLTAQVLHDGWLHGRFPGPYLATVLPFYALSSIRVAALGGSLALSFALIVLSLREEIEPVRKAILSILSVFFVFSAVLLTSARVSIAHLMALFPAVLFVFYGVPGRVERLQRGKGALEAILATTILCCLVLGAAIQRPGSWIVMSVWLPVVPFLILLIALERKAIFAARGMCLVLAFFCGVAFVNGIQESKDRILKYKDYNAARIAFLGKHTSAGDAILFGDTGSMEHAGPLFFDRVFLVTRNPGDPERFARRLRDKGIDGFYVWTENPLGIKGFNPYGGDLLPSFPFPSGARPGCGGSTKDRTYHLVRLDTRAVLSAGAGRGGSEL